MPKFINNIAQFSILKALRKVRRKGLENFVGPLWENVCYFSMMIDNLIFVKRIKNDLIYIHCM